MERLYTELEKKFNFGNQKLSHEVIFSKFDKLLKSGENIDKKLENQGTILLKSIKWGDGKIVEKILDAGADVSIESKFRLTDTHDYYSDVPEKYYDYSWNALEFAILRFKSKSKKYLATYELVKRKSLQTTAAFGLTELHIECALGHVDEIDKHIQQSNVNKKISSESSIWPGMTPLLIAAKFDRRDVLDRLIDFGASPNCHDLMGNTPLHYMWRYKYFDKRFILYDDNTFGFHEGCGTHQFHIACLASCVEDNNDNSIDVVEHFLQRGIPPDLKMKFEKPYQSENSCPETGIKIANTNLNIHLARLLFKYGSDVDYVYKDGKTNLQKCLDGLTAQPNNTKLLKYICLLLEAGADSDTPAMRQWMARIFEYTQHLRWYNLSAVRDYLLKFLKRMLVMDKNFVSKKLHDYYEKIVNVQSDFDDKNYGEQCSREIERLVEKGLWRQELIGNVELWHDFKYKFGDIVSSSSSPEFPLLYPIYGEYLQFQLEKRLIQFENKKKKVNRALPYLRQLLRQLCQLPEICAQEILWYFTCDELSKFINNIY